MVSPEDIKGWIEAGIEDCTAAINGDGRHFEAVIVSPAFVGKSRIQQHQLVYGVLGDKMQATIHALSMKTFSPEEYAAKQPL